MSKLFHTGFKLKDLEAMKHGLQYRLQRENISKNDKQYEEKLIDDLQQLINTIKNRYGCGCPR